MKNCLAPLDARLLGAVAVLLYLVAGIGCRAPLVIAPGASQSMASQRDEANPGLTVDEEDNGLSPCSVVALVPPARLALAHASAYRTWFDLRGAPPGAELHLKLDDSPTKRLLTSPAEVALGELGHVGLGTHVLVAWAVAANGSLLRGEGARGAGVVVRFEVFDHEFEGGAR